MRHDIRQVAVNRIGAWLEASSRADSNHLTVAESIQLAWTAAKRFSKHRGNSRAAALALYVMLSLAPMLVLLVAVGSYFFSLDTVLSTLLWDLHLLMGHTGAEAIETVLAAHSTEPSGIAEAMIYGAVVLVSGSSAFAELKDSLDELWEVERVGRRGLSGLLRERLLALAFLFLLALLLVASLVLNAGLAMLSPLWDDFWKESVTARIAGSLAQAFSVLVVGAFFAAIMKLLPGVKVAWRDVGVGALVTALLFDVGRHLIGLYLRHRAIASVYGAAGSLVALIIWFYYSAAIFFYGALLTHEFAIRFGSRRPRTGPHETDPLGPGPTPGEERKSSIMGRGGSRS